MDFLFGLIWVYLSLCLGVYMKFYAQGVRGVALCFSLYMPFSVLVIAAAGAFREAFRHADGGLMLRLREGAGLVFIAYRYFPVLVGMTAVKLRSRTPSRVHFPLLIVQVADLTMAGLYDIRAQGVKA